MSGPATVGEAALVGKYGDGAWHRMHAATPLLRGGIGIVAVGAYVANTFRERLVGLFFGVPGDRGGDPIDALSRHHLVPVAAVIAVGVLILCVALFWVSWRASEFRIDGDSVTVRRGVVIRRVRTAKLDRIQGVTVGRPLLARLVGAARIELDVAGHDANVRLEYLSNAAAEQLRSDVLALASGVGGDGGEPSPLAAAGRPVAGHRILHISPARAVLSVVFSDTTAWIVVLLAVAVPFLVSMGGPAAAISLVPVVFGGITVSVRRVGRNLRYSIWGTADGLRIGAGILSTSSEVVPPGRVHAIRVRQPLVWRPAGWWHVIVNRAGRIQGRRNNDLERAIAPVATRPEAVALLPYLVPRLTERVDVLEQALTGSGRDAVFTPAPRRARWLRPFAWRRSGFALVDGALLIRGGWARRHLTIVPQARIQSVSLDQNPAERLLAIASVDIHVVHGPVHARIELVDAMVAQQLFRDLAEAGRRARERDTSHRWGSLPPVADRYGEYDRQARLAAPIGEESP